MRRMSSVEPAYLPDPPEPVRRPIMKMTWATLTFLHWPYRPDEVQPLLPPGLRVETFRDRAWVGLVPFAMTVRWPGMPALPWLSFFPETNVRTYATGPDGRSGVWFLSLDAARLPAVLAARVGWGLPYFWSRMRVRRAGDVVRYDSVRRWPGPAAHLHAEASVGAELTVPSGPAFEHFLTARYALWAYHAGRLWRSKAEHPRWALRRAGIRRLDTSLLTAAGLPSPSGAPVVHFADGVEVRVARPTLVSS
jgi:uncharacterized protein